MSFIDYLIIYLPAIVGVVTCICSIGVSVSRVKKAIGGTKESNVHLKKALEKAEIKLVNVEEKLSNNIDSLMAEMESKNKECLELAKENAELKKAMSKVSELIDSNKTIQDQLTLMLNKGE